MSKINEFLNKDKIPVNVEIIDGTYGCSQCDENMDKAYFDSDAGKLVWICPASHVTEITIV